MGRLTEKKIIEASTVISSSDETAEFEDMAYASEVDFYIDIEAVTGSPTVTIRFQSGHTSGGRFYDVQTFDAYDTALIYDFKAVKSGIGKFCRLSYEYSGSGTLTLSINAVIKEDW